MGKSPSLQRLPTPISLEDYDSQSGTYLELYSAKQQREALLEFFAPAKDWHQPMTLNLTFKQSARHHNTNQCHTGDNKLELTRERASQNVRHVLNQTNRSIFGHSAQRKNNKSRFLGYFEEGDDKRLHYHAIMETSPFGNAETLWLIFESFWRKSNWGYYNNLSESREVDFGWVSYIAKNWDKPSYSLAFDWQNVHMG